MSEAYTLMHVPVRLVPTIQGIAKGDLVAVPREPTPFIVEDGSIRLHELRAAVSVQDFYDVFRQQWARALAAAQEPPR